MIVGLALLLAFQPVNADDAANKAAAPQVEQGQARPSAGRCHSLAHLPQRLRALHRAELHECAVQREPVSGRHVSG